MAEREVIGMKDYSSMNAFIDIKVNKMEWKGSLQDVVNIDMKDFNGELLNQATLVSWFGTVLAEAIASYEELKDRKERVHASVYLREKDNADKSGAKVTEAKLSSLVLVDDEYEKVQKEYNIMGKQVGILKSLARSLEHRRDMLIQLSANIRKEHLSGDYGFEADGSVDLNKIRKTNQPT